MKSIIFIILLISPLIIFCQGKIPKKQIDTTAKGVLTRSKFTKDSTDIYIAIGAGVGSVRSNKSITGTGTIGDTLHLLNDTTGTAKKVFYGADTSGRRGFYTLITIILDTTTLANGNVLKYVAAGKYWTNKPDTGTTPPAGGGGGVPSGALENIIYTTVAGGLAATGTVWSGTAASYGAYGLAGKVLGSTIDGYYQEKFTASDGTGIIGVRLDSVNQIWSANNYKAAAFCIGSGQVYYIDNGGAPVATAANCTAGDYIRIKRTTTAWILQKSADGTTWGDGTTPGAVIYTYTYAGSARMYLVGDVDGTNKLYDPKCYNCQ